MNKQKGFTLIELLVVIAIIGVMAALVIVNLASANKKSRDSRRKADLSEVRTALELYYDDNVSYPATGWSSLTTTLTPTYIKVLPNDPRAGQTYTYTLTSGSYTLGATLEAPKSGESANYVVYGTN